MNNKRKSAFLLEVNILKIQQKNLTTGVSQISGIKYDYFSSYTNKLKHNTQPTSAINKLKEVKAWEKSLGILF